MSYVFFSLYTPFPCLNSCLYCEQCYINYCVIDIQICEACEMGFY